MYRAVILLAVIAFANLAFAAIGRTELVEARERCAKENGVDVTKLQRGPSDDPKIKCYDACIMKARGHLKDDGTMDVEKAIDELPKRIPDLDRIVAAMRECGSIKSKDDCETVNDIWKCFAEKKALPPK